VTWFGAVSLAADLVYEGARSITGPYLASLGASALVIGLVTGAGEAAALGFRLFSGPYADRSGRYWSLTILGYAMTAVCVPLMALAPFVGSAGLALAATLVIAERTGKAVRSPAKSALLAQVAVAVGRGKGLGVHKALDQIGAFSGPLIVAAVVALTSAVWAGFAVLAIPGAVAIALLLVLRARVPDPSTYSSPGPVVSTGSTGPVVSTGSTSGGSGLGQRFYLFAIACAANTLGLMTFGIIAFHLVEAGIVAVAAVPLVYAAAMAVEAAAALITGFGYDRWGGRVLLAVPVLVALVPWLAFDDGWRTVAVGVAVWGCATGIVDSTVKALVADLVPSSRLATAYGVFAAFQGGGALLGGGLAGWLYADGRLDLVAAIATTQVVGLVLLIVVLRRRPTTEPR
jgi:MFS family permease